jgi:hypothetical protein
MCSGVVLGPVIKATLRKITVQEPMASFVRSDCDLARDRQRFLESVTKISSEPRPRKWSASA